MAKSRTSGQGRPKGCPNKLTARLKDMILTALDDAGGIDYLRRQAEANPCAFLTLLGRVLPTTLNASAPGEIVVSWQSQGGTT